MSAENINSELIEKIAANQWQHRLDLHEQSYSPNDHSARWHLQLVD
jgi:hypothetical protein